MATTVNILCPNGRRQNIKASPNETVLQILEKACVKYGYKPEEYGLRHMRSLLDVTSLVRYSSLPNHAKLEMVKLDKPRADALIHIAVQLESGERLENDFLSSTNLFEVLSHLQDKNDRLSLTTPIQRDDQECFPVCVYMRKEVVGEAWFKATTLKSLGLTSGKAIIRHMFRATDLPPPPKKVLPPKTQNATNMPDLKTGSPKPQSDSSSEADSSSIAVKESQVSDSQGTMSRLSANQEPMDTSEVSSSEQPTASKIIQSGEMEIVSNDEVASALNAETETDSMDFEEKESMSEKEAFNLPSTSSGARPKERKMVDEEDKPSSSNQSSTKGTDSGKTVDSFLQEHGVGGVNLDARTRERIERLLKKEEEMIEEMSSAFSQAIERQVKKESEEARTAQAISSSSNLPFSDFKFPTNVQPKAQNLKSSKLPDEEEQNVQPCERNTSVFSTDDVIPNAEQFQDLPDEFFDVTINDVKSMLSDLRHEQVGTTEDVLETKAMREAKMREKMEKYDKAVVRIHFPSRFMLQGFFKPQEKVEALYDFVQKNLAQQQSGFYLYTTPPKEILKKKSQTLFEAKLCPAAVVYFGAEKWKGPYLSEATISKKVSLQEAEEKVITQSNIQPSEEQNPTASSSQPGRRRQLDTSASTSSPTSSAKEGKIPKWFKMGKK